MEKEEKVAKKSAFINVAVYKNNGEDDVVLTKILLTLNMMIENEENSFAIEDNTSIDTFRIRLKADTADDNFFDNKDNYTHLSCSWRIIVVAKDNE